ncbi:hypothetical protein CCY99_07090 [Helicobacter sp. 16-1353]|uniref:radical SAM protein n=1 Tax=Helicobacter sp. 16-1353 TaxID=2004996 RepID=UPI000DCF243F|nr:radical SAM protein [Helicobacter sp. 16-1353]RAX52727.1 hypothetical protein CCY99_07090 [Helicobacter sp. 16-1353]
MNIVFGPIISRRFGISLGVDLSPYKKQCNFDCVYCELSYARRVSSFEQILPLSDLLKATKDALNIHKNINYLTITANGEPTLYPYLEEFINEIKPFIPKNAKSLILSNGSLFGESKIQRALGHFDVVKFSLDSGESKSFKKVDRPLKNLSLESIKKGIESYAKIRQNMLICEVLIVKDINDNEYSILPLVEFLKEIKVDRIDLSTIDRPPAYNVKALSYMQLQEISKLFKGLFVSLPQRKQMDNMELLSLSKDEILDLLKKRPIDIKEIYNILDESSVALVKEMLGEKKISIKTMGLIDFYTL